MPVRATWRLSDWLHAANCSTHAVFPPLPLSALSSSPFHCAPARRFWIDLMNGIHACACPPPLAKTLIYNWMFQTTLFSPIREKKKRGEGGREGREGETMQPQSFFLLKSVKAYISFHFGSLNHLAFWLSFIPGVK